MTQYFTYKLYIGYNIQVVLNSLEHRVKVESKNQGVSEQKLFKTSATA